MASERVVSCLRILIWLIAVCHSNLKDKLILQGITYLQPYTFEIQDTEIAVGRLRAVSGAFALLQTSM